jgi:hypothetical protein
MLKLFKILVILILPVLIGVKSVNAQYCGTPTSTQAITPTSSTQNTSSYSSGHRVFTFNATVGCTYSFSTCNLSSADTYLRLYSVPSLSLLVSADDQCGLQSSISWNCPTSGTYSILLSNYPCNPLSSPTQMAYSVSCSSGGAPPNVTSINAYSFCETTTLTANGAFGTVFWFTSGCNTAGQIGTGNTISVTPATTTTYYARNFNNGVWSNSCASITLSPPPQYVTSITAEQDTICAGDTTRLIANGASGTVLWFKNGCFDINQTQYLVGTGDTISVSPAQTGLYFARNFNNGVYSCGCTNINITVNSCLDPPLPVELTSFQAKCQDDGSVNVTWTTATELNSSHYLVEKSRNGIDWVLVTTVPAAENSVYPSSYAIDDNEIHFSIVYYRLTQVDNNGTAKQFNIVSTNCENTINGTTISSYPNPSSSDFYVKVITDEMEGLSTLQLFDMKGVVLYTDEVMIENGVTLIHIQNKSLATGVYYISITNENAKSAITKHSVK